MLAVFGAAGWASVASAQSDDGSASVPTSWWLRLRSTGYAFETTSPSGDRDDRFGAYQDVRGAVTGLVDNRVSVHVGGRVADDLYLDEKVTTRTRLHIGYVDVRPGTSVRARFGRHWRQSGAMSLTLDGTTFTVRPSRALDVSVWGGVRAPADRGLDVESAGDEGAFGAEFRMRPARWGRAGLSFAYRERDGRIAERPVALDATAAPAPQLRLVGRAVYDVETEAWSRAEAQARWQPSRRAPTFTFQLLDRRPSIDATSYFSRFLEATERIRLGRLSARYVHDSGIGGEVEYSGTYIDDRSSSRFSGAVIAPQGRIGYSARVGDAGEETGLFGEIGIRPTPWMRLAGGATRVTYALIEDASDDEERELITSFASAELTVRPGVDVSVEIQSLENPIFSEDIRVLLGLDITAGRGSSRFGLDRGGFFQ
jgi:hypothetical protein